MIFSLPSSLATPLASSSSISSLSSLVGTVVLTVVVLVKLSPVSSAVSFAFRAFASVAVLALVSLLRVTVLPWLGYVSLTAFVCSVLSSPSMVEISLIFEVCVVVVVLTRTPIVKLAIVVVPAMVVVLAIVALVVIVVVRVNLGVFSVPNTGFPHFGIPFIAAFAIAAHTAIVRYSVSEIVVLSQFRFGPFVSVFSDIPILEFVATVANCQYCHSMPW